MFGNQTEVGSNTPCQSVVALPPCAKATAGSPHPVRPFNTGIVERYNLSYDEILAWRYACCSYRNAYNHEEPAVPSEELAQYSRESPFHVQHQRMAGQYAERMGHYHKAYTSDRTSNPLNLSNVALREFTVATAKDDTAGILRAFEYAGWDIKE